MSPELLIQALHAAGCTLHHNGVIASIRGTIPDELKPALLTHGKAVAAVAWQARVRANTAKGRPGNMDSAPPSPEAI